MAGDYVEIAGPGEQYFLANIPGSFQGRIDTVKYIHGETFLVTVKKNEENELFLEANDSSYENYLNYIYYPFYRRYATNSKDIFVLHKDYTYNSLCMEKEGTILFAVIPDNFEEFPNITIYSFDPFMDRTNND